ncbi:hypothetical protein NECAME_04294 [Necator americanus]|uniref:DUF7774 domain-containing protein n=1 Tax=Necator americanus TaxID=51031 RepID=W2SVN8_NECAM|nr:hypothetical protein NECAME_04294 [Necator americanus]ETN73608.1 hypothetical protein NECAME_04294 [Necator americanus]
MNSPGCLRYSMNGKKVDANFVRKGYQEFLTKTNKSTIQRAALQPKPMSKAQKREEMRKRGEQEGGNEQRRKKNEDDPQPLKILEDVTQDSKEIIKEHEARKHTAIGTSGENEQIGPQPKRSEEKTVGSSPEKDQREQLKIDFGISTNSRETDCSFPQEMASASALSSPSDDLRSTRDDVFSALEEKKTLEAAKKILRISHKEKAIEKTLTKEENEIISKFFSGKIPYDQTVLNVLDRVLDKTIDYLQTHGTTLDPETKRLVEKRKKENATMDKADQKNDWLVEHF